LGKYSDSDSDVDMKTCEREFDDESEPTMSR